MGEHLSPKYAPDNIAPAAIEMLTPPLLAITISAIPTVPIVPKEVPIKNDTNELIKNAESINIFGFKKFHSIIYYRWHST